MIELTPAARRDLRARAHHLSPVVTIASHGLSASVITELEHSLQAHELIKVRVHGAERDQRETLMASLCATLEAAPVQHIGNILIVWRARREKAPTGKKPAAPDKNRATAKSAAAFAAAARRAALARAAVEQKHRALRRERPRGGR
jgi:putative YhbY family RNA-binding protein